MITKASYHSALLLPTLGRLWLLLLLSLVSGCGLVKDIPVGQGFAAKHLCSLVFIAGMDAEWVKREVIAPKVKPLPWIWQVSVDQQRQTTRVGTWLPGFSHQATAIHRPGLGCTLLTTESEAQLRARPFTPLPPPALDAKLPWPDGSAGVDQSQLSAQTLAALNEIAAEFFQLDGQLGLNTTAFLIVKDGRLLFEQYALGADAFTPSLGWSLTKSITATLAGILWDQQRFSLDQPFALPNWRQSADPKFNPRHLLHMSSGLYVNESYAGLTEVTQMLYLEPDQFSYALSQSVTFPPGQEFQYSTAETARLSALVQHLAGGSEQAMYNFYQQQLFHPLGIATGLVEFDATGHMVGGGYGHLSARDWARLGQLYLQGGQWQGKSLLSKDWLKFALTPAATNQEYGAQLWLNTDGLRWPSVAADAFLLAGYDGQRVIMLPSANLMIVRLGMGGDQDTLKPIMERLINQLLQALPS